MKILYIFYNFRRALPDSVSVYLHRISYALLASAVPFIIPSALFAHGIETSVTVSDKAAVVSVNYRGGETFSYESYEVYPPSEGGSEVPPFQTGRTDAKGRIVFLPDKPGEWKVKFHSDDGHGGEVTVHVNETGMIEVRHAGLTDAAKYMLAAGIILSAAGALSLYYSLKKS